MIDLGKHIGPYYGISRDAVVSLATPKGIRRFRVIVYGVYCSGGIFGSEHNGLAIFDHDRGLVIADRLVQQDSGYFGPSIEQVNKFKELMAMQWNEFQAWVNSQHARLRMPI